MRVGAREATGLQGLGCRLEGCLLAVCKKACRFGYCSISMHSPPSGYLRITLNFPF